MTKRSNIFTASYRLVFKNIFKKYLRSITIKSLDMYTIFNIFESKF